MNKRRIQMMIDLLKTIPDENFNLGIYMNECKTIGCALGWAGRSPQFNAEGFELHHYSPHHNTVEYHDDFGPGAAAAFFEISLREAESIFYITHSYPLGKIRPAHVIAKLEALLTTEDRP